MIVELPPLVFCPSCHGTGQSYSVVHHTLVTCVICQGRCVVSAVTCRGCGRPVTKYWPPNQRPIIQYCGQEACFSAMVTIHKRATFKATPMIVQAVNKIMGPSAPKRINEMEELRNDLIRRELGPTFKVNTAFKVL